MDAAAPAAPARRRPRALATSVGPPGAAAEPAGLRGKAAFAAKAVPIKAGAERGLAFRQSTTQCTSVRTSGVAIARKCLQIGVREVIGAESLPLRQPH